MSGRRLTLPTELEIDHIRDLDIDDTEETLVGLSYCQLPMLMWIPGELTFLLNFLWSKIWTATTDESLTVLKGSVGASGDYAKTDDAHVEVPMIVSVVIGKTHAWHMP